MATEHECSIAIRPPAHAFTHIMTVIPKHQAKTPTARANPNVLRNSHHWMLTPWKRTVKKTQRNSHWQSNSSMRLRITICWKSIGGKGGQFNSNNVVTLLGVVCGFVCITLTRWSSSESPLSMILKMMSFQKLLAHHGQRFNDEIKRRNMSVCPRN